MTTLGVLEERLKNLKEQLKSSIEDAKTDVDEKHRQNRSDVHKIYGELQKLNDQIWLLKLKIAGYAGGGSAIAVGLEQFIKWLVHH